MLCGAVAIVKNEAESIERIAGWPVDGWTLVDTGSTDETWEVLEALAADRRVFVSARPFDDFGHARSDALAKARGSADWLLTLDADMTVEIDPDFEPDPAVDAYMIRMGDDPDFAYRLPLLLRGDLPWESRGPVHEYTCLPDRDYAGVPTDKVRITLHGNRSSGDKSRWHASLLEAHLREHPDAARETFYLAQSYHDLGDPRAIALYEKRERMGGYAEEVFYSAYRLGLLLPTWPARLHALIRAWEMRPSRLEPPYEIAKSLNALGQHHSAYRFATVPREPTADSLFVHASVWRWGLDFEQSIAAWWLGRHDECRDLCDDLLTRAIPDHIRAQVEKNRALC